MVIIYTWLERKSVVYSCGWCRVLSGIVITHYFAINFLSLANMNNLELKTARGRIRALLYTPRDPGAHARRRWLFDRTTTVPPKCIEPIALDRIHLPKCRPSSLKPSSSVLSYVLLLYYLPSREPKSLREAASKVNN